MGISKTTILKHIILSTLRRRFRSDRPSQRQINKWRKNLLKSEYYRAYADQPLHHFPMISKNQFMEKFEHINTVGIGLKEAYETALRAEQSRDFSPTINGISVGLSSGTSGNKGIFLTSNEEKATWVGTVVDRVIGFSFKKRKVAFFLRANNNLYEATNSSLLSFTFYDIKDDINTLFNQLIAQNPQILVAQPSVLYQLAKRYLNKKVTPKFDKVISVAEVLEPDQKELFTKVFKCPIDQVYQCTEGFLAHTCTRGNLHFNEDWIHIEKKYIDRSKSRFHPIITDYKRMSQPVIRYELNDIIHEGPPCDCGLKSTTIAKIEGRSDDVFEFKHNGEEIIVFPDFMRRAVINSSDLITNYQVAKHSNELLTLYVEPSNIFDIAKESIEATLASKGLTNIKIEERQYDFNGMKKFKRITDESKA